MELLSMPPQAHPNGVPNQATDAQPPLADVITSLELATQTLRILPSSTEPSHVLQAYAALRNAHHQIGSLLSRLEPRLDPTVENSSASNGVGRGGEEDEPMADEEEASEETDNLKIIQKVEEEMRECALRSKRLKRPLSPYWVPQRSADDDVRGTVLLGQKERLRSFDLIFQFHG